MARKKSQRRRSVPAQEEWCIDVIEGLQTEHLATADCESGAWALLKKVLKAYQGLHPGMRMEGVAGKMAWRSADGRILLYAYKQPTIARANRKLRDNSVSELAIPN